MSDGSVRNAYTLKLRNMESRPRRLRIALEGLPGATMWSDEIGRDDASRALTTGVQPDSTASLRVYVIAPPNTPAQDFEFDVTSLDEQVEMAESETRFSAPGDE
jgi:polyferredoxin